jgi:hypothetical protein
MATKRLPLVRVEEPCDIAWDAMRGSDRSRRCDECDRTVFDLGAITASEAERLLADSEGRRLCVTFARGPDGHPITKDRPARFQWRPLATASRAAATAALTMSMSGAAIESASPAAIARQQGASAAAAAATPRGGLRGTIRVYGIDDAVDRATVRARDQHTGVEFSAQSREDGTYRLLLPKGRYDIFISAAGLSICRVEGVDVGNRVLTADAALEVPVLGEVVYPRGYDGCNNKKISRLGHKKNR